MIRHIPQYDPRREGIDSGVTEVRTYCGRWVPPERCINTRVGDRLLRPGREDCIEDAECRACQRSDDRRVYQQYRADVKAGRIEGP